jgi:hypothetical protein
MEFDPLWKINCSEYENCQSTEKPEGIAQYKEMLVIWC